MARTDAERFSYSRLQAYEECPRKYEFRYVRREREAFDTVEAFMGRTVHETLAFLYRERERRGTVGESEALEHYDATWRAKLGPRVAVIKAEDSLERQQGLGRDMVAAHHREAYARDDRATLAVEEAFDVGLGGAYRYTGIIDRRARDGDGTLHVVDYKTTGRPPQVIRTEDALQLRSYGFGTLATYGGERLRLTYLFLRTGQCFDLTMTAAEAGDVESVLSRKVADTRAASSFPARPSSLCAWCGYRDRCDASGFATTRPSAQNRTLLDGGAGAPAPPPGRACPRCGATLEVRHGRRGPFVGCAGYPDCRFTRDLTPEEAPGAAPEGNACPRCGGALRRRSGRRGDFLGCERFPECRYSRDA